MRKIPSFYYICLAFILSILTFNCKKDTKNKPDNPPIPIIDSVPNKNVHVIDSTKLILNSDSTLLNQGRYEYTFTGTSPEFIVKDVIVGATNGGYIRRISSVSKQSNKIILETTQGNMEDVFQNAGFNFKTGIDSLLQAPTTAGYQFDVSGQTLYQDPSITIKFDKGIINMDGDWNFGFNFKSFRLDSFEMSCKNASFNGQFDLNVSASQATTLAEKTSALARVAKYNTFLVGEIPVVLYTEVELRCVFSASISASSQGNILVNTNNTANVGVKYQNSQWQNTFNNTSNSSITVNKGTDNINAQIKMGIVPYISFRLYRVLGPYFSFGLQELVKASVAVPSLDWDFSTAAWLQTVIGVRANIIGNSLFDFNKEWNTDSLFYKTPYLIDKISGDNQTGVANQYLSQPIKVRILDNNNKPQSNVFVDFSITAGGGSVKNSPVLTDNNGYAEVLWKLGSQFGIQTVNATVKKADGTFIQNVPIEFAATISQAQPTLTTTGVTSITETTAISGGNITNDGGSSISNRGVCWSTSANPTIANSKTNDGIGIGIYNSNINELTGNTTYYARAYATNNSGTSYGNEVSFNTQSQEGTFTDPRDGQVYPFKTIGSQVWMTKNLNYAASGSLCYDNNSENCAIYGRLYDWNTAYSVAPAGWHLPSDAEWTVLTTFLGGDSVAGGKMKGPTFWVSPNTGASNSSGFTAIPGGSRYGGPGAAFYHLGFVAFWWSSSRSDFNTPPHVLSRQLNYDNAGVYRITYWGDFAFSVRCVRN